MCNQINNTHAHTYALYKYSANGVTSYTTIGRRPNWSAWSETSYYYDYQNKNKKQNKIKISSYRALPTTRTTVLALPPANGVQNTPWVSDPTLSNPCYWALVAPWSPKRDLRGNAWRGQHVNDDATPGDLLRLYTRVMWIPSHKVVARAVHTILSRCD